MSFLFLPLSAFLALAPPSLAAGAQDEEVLLEDEGLVRGRSGSAEKKKRKRGEEEPEFEMPEFDEPDEAFDLDDEPELGGFDEPMEGFDLDEPMEDFDRPESSRQSRGLALESAGREPLAGNYPLTVVAVERDAVVVELPVLVSRSRLSIESPFWLEAEVRVGGERITTVRQEVRPASVAEFGASFAFFKLLVPVSARSGEIAVTVRDVDGEDRFTKTTPYALASGL